MPGGVGSMGNRVSMKIVKFETTTPNTSQHGATGRINAPIMLRPTMLQCARDAYVLLTGEVTEKKKIKRAFSGKKD